jgi:arginine-tRNA-protein transferase
VVTREIVIYDQPHECPYLPEQTARLPYRQPTELLAPAEFDRKLASGDRRSGVFLYRPHCPACQACEPIRVDVANFAPRATQRRTLRRGDELLEISLGEPRVDEVRIDLFNAHRAARGLDHGDAPIDLGGYSQFLADSCCTTCEICYWHAGELVGVAITDLGREALSAVYCYYDPSYRGVGLGTYSVLKQVEFCRQTERRYLYLGYYVAPSQHMSYKALFRPHERLIAGVWQRFE